VEYEKIVENHCARLCGERDTGFFEITVTGSVKRNLFHGSMTCAEYIFRLLRRHFDILFKCNWLFVT